jgi:hypothetical protein
MKHLTLMTAALSRDLPTVTRVSGHLKLAATIDVPAQLYALVNRQYIVC